MSTENLTLGLGNNVTSIGYANYQDLYKDWCNNFLTLAGFADYHHITIKLAERLVVNACFLYGG